MIMTIVMVVVIIITITIIIIITITITITTSIIIIIAVAVAVALININKITITIIRIIIMIIIKTMELCVSGGGSRIETPLCVLLSSDFWEKLSCLSSVIWTPFCLQTICGEQTMLDSSHQSSHI
jgi:hypothetical protein